MKTSITLFLCALAAVNAYEFEDQAYNQLIAEELHPLHYRGARDTTQKCIDQNSCCSGPPISNFHASDKEASQQCSKEVNFNRGSIRGPLTAEQKDQIKCIAECIGKKKGYLTADGELIKDKLLSSMKERLQSVAWLAPKLDSMFEDCLPQNENTAKQPKKCNDVGLTVGHCIWKQIQLQCPLNEQQNPQNCKNLQEYLTTHNQFPPAPPVKC
uniref:Odorant binding protein 11 n=1 Tax=Anomala corpulenta TaxID=931571 RepID=A0A0E3U2J2_9SCAR|nr:odorant binding protein 11 [Anomala corpulenta]